MRNPISFRQFLEVPEVWNQAPQTPQGMKHFLLLARTLHGLCLLEVKRAPRIPGSGVSGGYLDQQDKILLVSSLSCQKKTALKFHFAAANSVFTKQARFYFWALLLRLITRYRNQEEEREMNLNCLKKLDWYEGKAFPLEFTAWRELFEIHTPRQENKELCVHWSQMIQSLGNYWS